MVFLTLPNPGAADESQLRVYFKDTMQICRDGTLALVDGISKTVLQQQAHADFSPVGWHLGHIAFTESLWILEHLAQQPCPYPNFRQLFAADGLPKSQRQLLPELEELLAFLTDIRQRTLVYLSTAPLNEQRRLWHWLIQHECQHSETMTLVMALHQTQGLATPLREPSPGRLGAGGSPARVSPTRVSPTRVSPTSVGGIDMGAINEGLTDMGLTDMVQIPGGSVGLGLGTGGHGLPGDMAMDNEQPVHWVEVVPYQLDRTPVTCEQYQRFMLAGGYQDRQWWCDAGWRWLQTSQVCQPLYWPQDPMAFRSHPVCGVNWYEASAYGRFVGKRLPTEAEWAWAAHGLTTKLPTLFTTAQINCNHRVGHTSPVGVNEQAVSDHGCYDLLGNVWEWTSSWFEAYPGFKSYPYRGYSEIYFDGRHRVLRGGSWATRFWALRPSFRNWYEPHVRELFMGFRCAQ